MSVVDKITDFLVQDTSTYPAVRVDDELYEQFQQGLATAESDSGPRLRVRPPRENEGMDASINLYETVHEPRESKIGIGRHKLVTTDSHIHSHEMVYDEGKLQFFFKPDTRVDANQFERQLRKNYPDAQISEANKRFPTLDQGDYIAMAEMRLKRPFYYPIKCKISEEDFEMDPYGDITSDMVVEEDQTSSGRRVAAEDCRVMVQTIFEPARDVWTKRLPYGRNVTDAAAKIKEGEVVGNMIEGFEIRDPGSKRTRTAKIIDKLHGAKGYYFTVRVLAISPYEEIAERRCNTVASDYEKYYNSFTEQGLEPVAIEPDQVPTQLEQMAERTHSVPWIQRIKFGPGESSRLQTVSALGSIAHIPDESINTPVVDWAKQQTGPGIPAESTQVEDTNMDEEGSSGVDYGETTFGSPGSTGAGKGTTDTPSEPPETSADRVGGAGGKTRNERVDTGSRPAGSTPGPRRSEAGRPARDDTPTAGETAEDPSGDEESENKDEDPLWGGGTRRSDD